MTTATLTFPRPERDLLIRVRTGKYSTDKVTSMAQELFAVCEEATRESRLPEKINREAVSKLIADCYRESWSSASITSG